MPGSWLHLSFVGWFLNIALVYYSLGEKQKALDFFEQALGGKLRIPDRQATALNNIGVVYHNLGEAQKALEFYNQALPLIRAVGDHQGEAASLNNIGGLYNVLGEKQKVLNFLNQALPLFRAAGDRDREDLTLYNLAELERNRGNLQAVMTRFELSLQIIESLRTQVASQELRASYFAIVQDYYHFYIKLLMQLHKTNPSQGYDSKALAASEKGRARGLLELPTDSSKALDFQASLETATNPNLAQYRIVHFATHGILNSVNPELSGLVLSLVDEKGNPENGFLRLHDKLLRSLIV